MMLEAVPGDASTLEWIKSSYSSNDGPDCVEVAATTAAVHIRDSKDVHGPQLAVPHAAWADFVSQIG
jgi:hypothetical protein